MLRVGLTGGIGAGKSTVARRLIDLGAVLIDADRIAREVVEPGTPGIKAVVAEFGSSIVRDDGSLDRAALGRIVFADESRRQALNAIVHPLVGERRADLIARAPADAVVVEDIPLLVENRLGIGFHLVLVVDAPAEERVRRLVADRGMSEDDAWARIRSQADDAARRAAADVVLDNNRLPKAVFRDVDELWRDRLVGFESNVRTQTVAKRPDTPTLVPYDETWPDQAARLAGRVAQAAGPHGLAVDHVGSTAVPRIQAKDVIDLQLTVRSLDDADAARAALGDAGFPHVAGFSDTPKPFDPDPAHWHKRLHGSADPGRIVHLHVREAGSPGWRYTLLFRDWLRAEPAEAAAYQAEKRRLASSHATTAAYAEAKEPWLAAALMRAEAWADGAAWTPPAFSPH
jgi:dephospho-CoA kinase